MKFGTKSSLFVVLTAFVAACGGTIEDMEMEDQASESLEFQGPTRVRLTYADLVAEVVSCGYAEAHFRVRNAGNIATDALACSAFYCIEKFETRIFNGQMNYSFWTEDLQPGESRDFVVPRPAGSEGLIWIRTDTWGTGDHSVVELTESNNYAEAFCVM